MDKWDKWWRKERAVNQPSLPLPDPDPEPSNESAGVVARMAIDVLANINMTLEERRCTLVDKFGAGTFEVGWGWGWGSLHDTESFVRGTWVRMGVKHMLSCIVL